MMHFSTSSPYFFCSMSHIFLHIPIIMNYYSSKMLKFVALWYILVIKYDCPPILIFIFTKLALHIHSFGNLKPLEFEVPLQTSILEYTLASSLDIIWIGHIPRYLISNWSKWIPLQLVWHECLSPIIWCNFLRFYVFIYLSSFMYRLVGTSQQLVRGSQGYLCGILNL